MCLAGKRVLVVEDEFFLAYGIQMLLEEEGCHVIGPCTTVKDAMACVGREAIDVAVLDVNLHGEMVYPVADKLKSLKIPFAFTSGYRAVDIGGPYRDVPRLEKPVEDRHFLATMRKLVGDDKMIAA